MSTNDELHTLGGLWQSLDKEVMPARPIADITRRRRAERMYLVIETAIALTGCTVGLVLASTGNVAIGLAALAYSVFGGMIGWITRSVNIGVLERSVAEHLEAAPAVLKARRNHNVAGVFILIAATLFYSFVRWQERTSFTGIDMVAAGGLLVAAVFFLYRARSAQRELSSWGQVKRSAVSG